ncbi:MAG: thiamine phosphate synthase [Negativicutes bacterium]|nr:thiamine phosphate synthase [Negativicutes bacterium]
MKNIDYRLYLATDDYYLDRSGIDGVIEQVLAAGTGVLQYRAKTRSSRQMLQEAGKLKVLSQKYKVPLIINDRLDIALAVEADGLHVGQDDLPLVAARALFPGRIIGVSATSYEQGREALLQGADYIGVGPVFATTTKKDAKAVCGLTVVARLRAEFPSARIVGIGGIGPANVDQVAAAGADGAAVISAIFDSGDPADAARRIIQAFKLQD